MPTVEPLVATQQPHVVLRPPVAADFPALSSIVYSAFKGISECHGFPTDFPSIEAARGMLEAFANHPAIFGVVAEVDGRVVGSNFLDERDAIRGVGPITVDPAGQSRGVGRRLMHAVIERGRGAAGVRLVQDAFNTASMSLYTSLGFDAKEPLALMRGKPRGLPAADGEVRKMKPTDLPACGELCRQAHGYERNGELADAIQHFGAMVFTRGGRVTAYASSPWFWIMNHGVGEAEEDLRGLYLQLGAMEDRPVEMLVPIRRAEWFRWLLGAGLRVVKPMTLMALGDYREPRGAFYPSVAY